jgi:hypothetical protein
VGRDLADQQDLVAGNPAVHYEEDIVYGKSAGAGGIIGGMLPVTGVNILYSALIAFVLIGAGFAVARCVPKRRTS